MFERFDSYARRCVVRAQAEARDFAHPEITTAHMLVGAAGVVAEGLDGAVLDPPLEALRRAFTSLGITVGALRDRYRELVPPASQSPAHLPFNDMARSSLEAGLQYALRRNQRSVTVVDLVVGALSKSTGTMRQLLAPFHTDPEHLIAVIDAMLHQVEESAPTAPAAAPGPDPVPAGGHPAAGGLTRRKGSVLVEHGRDLTAAARDGKLDPVIGRAQVVERVCQILSRRSKSNPVLVGDAGVGKTAVVEGLAQRIADGKVPDTLTDARIVELDLSSLLAGTKLRGDFEDRIKKVVAEASDRNTILFIDEVHTLVGSGSGSGSLGAAEILKPALARGELRLIGATTADEYRQVTKDKALERRFAPVEVTEPSQADAVKILAGVRPALEQHHDAVITDDAVTAAVELAALHLRDRRLPDSAIDLLDEAAARLRVRNDLARSRAAREAGSATLADGVLAAGSVIDPDVDVSAAASVPAPVRELLTVDGDSVAVVCEEWTGTPVRRPGEAERLALLELEATLAARVVGQGEAVTALARSVRRARAGLRDPRRPSSFLFSGPTGVGKTELAKALAEFLFGAEGSLVTFDMSEFMESHSVARLVGAPPGYVGHDRPGELTEALRRRPHCVLLFDEVDKAHPQVFDVLLALLEEGRVTDAQGRRAEAGQAIVIMTSNLGSADLSKVAAGGVGFARGGVENVRDAQTRAVTAALKKHFRPEFLNRFDELITFAPLTGDEIARIVGLQLAPLFARLAERGVTVEATPAAQRLLAAAGSDVSLGARPLRRAITQLVENPLAEMLLAGSLPAGSRCVVDALLPGGLPAEGSERDASLHFEVQPAEAASPAVAEAR